MSHGKLQHQHHHHRAAIPDRVGERPAGPERRHHGARGARHHPSVTVVDPPAETTAAVLELQVEVRAVTPWVDLTVADQTTRVAPGAQSVQVTLTPGANRLEVVAIDARGRRSARQVVTIQRRE